MHEVKNKKSKNGPFQFTDWSSIVNGIIKNIGKDAVIICWLFDKLISGKIEGDNVVFSDEKEKTIDDLSKITELRAFNDNAELRIWKSQGMLKGRIRKDDEGDAVEVVDAELVLWGTKAEKVDDSFSKLTEDRGTELILSKSIIDMDQVNKGKRMIATVRHYIDYIGDDKAQASYVDYRFKEIKAS